MNGPHGDPREPSPGRGAWQKAVDFALFPLRALTLFYDDQWGLTSLASERYEYVSREVRGYCLDVGCGRGNRFIREWRRGHGVGLDVFPYDGLTREQLVPDLRHFPFEGETFDAVTFIANINHIPEADRDTELREAHRVLRPGGRVVVTMGHPLAERLVHGLTAWYDRRLGTRLDMDGERGMHEDEAFFLTDEEIVNRLRTAEFVDIRKKFFGTQWGLNHLFVGRKAV